jgi:hypothetical protein
VARCGRCGLWSEYPEDHKESRIRGVCLWYQIRLPEEQVYESRKCPDFFERIPDLSPMGHFDYKTKRDNLGDAYSSAKRAKVLAYISLCVSLVGLGLKVFSG